MKIICVYREASEAARDVASWLREFERRAGSRNTIEIMNPDTRAGMDFCRLYDIVEYPTIIVITEDGQMIDMWRGLPLPLIDHVAKYL